ncbi:cortistatin [Kogia breviceps]|uniref:cortistatin n=1 Tax=Kogia breviceps TaxID=27615 RepID=UPI0027962B57|nr:cortistatin [Kogia breviceps]
MSSRRAGEKCQSACRMLPPLCLPPSGATAALPLEGGLGGHDSGHMQEVAEIKKNSLLTFLAWWYEWASQARAVSFVGGEAREVSKRQGVLPLQQSTQGDTTPCKNFFWKTFSSCK